MNFTEQSIVDHHLVLLNLQLRRYTLESGFESVTAAILVPFGPVTSGHHPREKVLNRSPPSFNGFVEAKRSLLNMLEEEFAEDPRSTVGQG